MPQAFEPLVAACLKLTTQAGPDVSTFLYGSVATGMAVPGSSDIDILTIGLPESDAARLSRELSERFEGRTRAVQIAVAQPEHFVGDGDEAHGNRVFLRHYCIPLAGPDSSSGWSAFPADARAARGFNGDIGGRLNQWRSTVRLRDGDGPDVAVLARGVARKTLFATAGLVSVTEGIWTTDRGTAVTRWAALRPALAEGLERLGLWSAGEAMPGWDELEASLHTGGVVDEVAREFRDAIGLWWAHE